MGLALGATACPGGSSPIGAAGQVGELGYAYFLWGCRGNGDLGCEPDYEDTLPSAIAVGASFDLTFELVPGVPDTIDEGPLVPASPIGVRALSFAYEATAEGRITMLALTFDGEVADYARFDVRAIDELRVTQSCEALDEFDEDGQPAPNCGDPVDPVQSVGAWLDVRVEPYADGAPLMGDRDYVWESLTPQLLRVQGVQGNETSLEMLRPGHAELRVRTGEVEQILALTIESSGPVDSSGPKRRRPGASDTGGSTGTDTESTGGSDDSTGTTTGGMQ